MSKRVRNHVNPLAITEEISFAGFANGNPVVVDVGAYRGEFVEGLADQFPDQNYIALEVRRRVADELQKKFARRDNIVVFPGDAGRNLRTILEPSMKRGIRIKEIFVNFPDPWFKKKHHKRRFINKDFLKETKTWIDHETRWVFQTDQERLFHDTVDILDELAIAYRRLSSSPYGVKTKWEKAKLAVGQEIYRLEFYL